jgi:hypothetical protein
MSTRNWYIASLLLGSAIAFASLPLSAGPADWPQFRGPGRLGVADGAKLPQRRSSRKTAWAK